MLRYIELFFMFAFVTLITMWIQALLAKWQPTILRSFWLRTLTFIIIGYALMAPTLYIGSFIAKISSVAFTSQLDVFILDSGR
ncbi:hypothetical protein BS613_11000 [Listeria monocytogenes]|nr:hypothetical protein BS613_11000 [Listeria monocytogenes]